MKNKFKYFIGVVIVVFLLIIINWNRLSVDDETNSVPIEVINVFKVKGDNGSFYIPTIYRGDCKVISIDSLKNFSSLNNFTNGLPKLLHYVSNEEDIAKLYTPMYKNCGKLNNDMMLVLWTDASFYKVFVTQFNDITIKKWSVIFSDLDDPLRTTMIRSMVIYLFGGVSLSLDTVCQQPIKNIFDNISNERYKCFVSVGNFLKSNIEFDRDFIYGESMIGCKAKHSFFNTLINNKMSMKLDRNYFTDYFEYYKKNDNNSFNLEILNISIAEQLFPKSEMERICSKNSTGVRRNLACNSIKTITVPNNSKSLMFHVPNYGISTVQIIADDICFGGIPVHIVII